MGELIDEKSGLASRSTLQPQNRLLVLNRGASRVPIQRPQARNLCRSPDQLRRKTRRSHRTHRRIPRSVRPRRFQGAFPRRRHGAQRNGASAACAALRASTRRQFPRPRLSPRLQRAATPARRSQSGAGAVVCQHACQRACQRACRPRSPAAATRARAPHLPTPRNPNNPNPLPRPQLRSNPIPKPPRSPQPDTRHAACPPGRPAKSSLRGICARPLRPRVEEPSKLPETARSPPPTRFSGAAKPSCRQRAFDRRRCPTQAPSLRYTHAQ
jgi:hypothetical protein